MVTSHCHELLQSGLYGLTNNLDASGADCHSPVNKLHLGSLLRRIEQCSSGDLGALDVWLVEWVDLEQIPGKSGCPLPHKKEFAQLTLKAAVRAEVSRPNRDRVRRDLRKLWCAAGYNNRKDSSTLFSSALGNQLLDPISEAGINITLDEELVPARRVSSHCRG